MTEVQTQTQEILKIGQHSSVECFRAICHCLVLEMLLQQRRI